MAVRFISARVVRDLLTMDRCIELMRHAMAIVSDGKAIQPVRDFLRRPGGHGVISWMPGHIGDPDWLGIKIVSIFPGRSGTPSASHHGMVLLFDPDHGNPVAIVDGQEITAIRTAAASAAATDVLARRDARTLSIFGYGDQARTHIAALMRVRQFRQIQVWGRSFDKAQRFCEAESERLGVEINPVASPETAAEADVICTVTGSPEPILFGHWLQPGQHINAVGSSIPFTSEIDVETVVRSRFFVDFKDSALALAGDFRRAKDAGAVTDEHIAGSVGDVIRGRVKGRISNGDVTLFKSLGMAAEDLVACDFILREADRLGAGTLVEWE